MPITISQHLVNNNIAVVKYKEKQHSPWILGVALMENDKVRYIIPDIQGFGDPKEANCEPPKIPERVWDYQILDSLEEKAR